MKRIVRKPGGPREFRREDYPTLAQAQYVGNDIKDLGLREHVERVYGVQDGKTYDIIEVLPEYKKGGEKFHCIMIDRDGDPITVNSALFRVSN